MIGWKDEYAIGVEEIDQQHQKLFELAGMIYDLLQTSDTVDKYDQIIGIIEELKNYTHFHFESEEKYMLENNYPKLFSHKMLHKEFIQKVNSVNLTSLDDNQTKYLLEILDFVLHWLHTHILQRDKLIVE